MRRARKRRLYGKYLRRQSVHDRCTWISSASFHCIPVSRHLILSTSDNNQHNIVLPRRMDLGGSHRISEEFCFVFLRTVSMIMIPNRASGWEFGPL